MEQDYQQVTTDMCVLISTYRPSNIIISLLLCNRILSEAAVNGGTRRTATKSIKRNGTNRRALYSRALLLNILQL